MNLRERYAKFKTGQVVRILKDNYLKKAGTLAVIQSVADGRASTVASEPIDVVFLYKSGHMMPRDRWFGFKHDEVEIVHESYDTWLAEQLKINDPNKSYWTWGDGVIRKKKQNQYQVEREIENYLINEIDNHKLAPVTAGPIKSGEGKEYGIVITVKLVPLEKK